MNVESTRSFLVVAVLGLSAASARAVTPEQASEMLLRQDWQGARAAYEELVSKNPDNPEYHYALGQAQHGLSNCNAAVAEYRKAMSLGHGDPGTARLQIARCHASLGERAVALAELARLAAERSGTYVSGPTNRTIAVQPEFATYGEDEGFRKVLEEMTPCNTPSHRQFDFWVGRWEIRTGSPDGAVAGVNEIRLINDGCTLHESYRSRNGGYVGQSFSFYDSRLDKWHQTWIDYLGFPLYMDGGLNERDEMVMIDDSSTPGTVHRTTWTPLPGSLRQHWQTSTDKGKTWNTVFDGYYSRLETAPTP